MKAQNKKHKRELKRKLVRKQQKFEAKKDLYAGRKELRLYRTRKGRMELARKRAEDNK